MEEGSRRTDGVSARLGLFGRQAWRPASCISAGPGTGVPADWWSTTAHGQCHYAMCCTHRLHKYIAQRPAGKEAGQNAGAVLPLFLTLLISLCCSHWKPVLDLHGNTLALQSIELLRTWIPAGAGRTAGAQSNPPGTNPGSLAINGLLWLLSRPHYFACPERGLLELLHLE